MKISKLVQTSYNYPNSLVYPQKNIINPGFKGEVAVLTSPRFDIPASRAYAQIKIDTSAIQKAKAAWKVIEETDNIIITAHEIADSDSITSGIILTDTIKQKFPNKKVTFYVPGGYPSFLKGVPNIDLVSGTPPEGKIGLAIAVDCTEDNMDGLEYFKRASNQIIFDHHESKQIFNDISMVNDKMASNTTLLYHQFLKPLGIEITPQTAENILTGILTDTGNFKYSEAGDLSVETRDELLKRFGNEVSVEKIIDKFCKNDSPSKELRELTSDLTKKMNSINIAGGKKINFITVNQWKLDLYKVKDSIPDIKNALSNIINSLPRDYINVLFFEIKKERFKVSLRSKDVDLRKFVTEFDGGAHPCSGGFKMNGSTEEVMSEVLSHIKNYKF